MKTTQTTGTDTITPFTDIEGHTQQGLTKREYFAAAALQGFLADPASADFDTREELTDSVVMYAEALIESLNKETK